ncbi:hypothetical protein HPB47_005386 [Ixodes persulcatus]|uniref:Uncharacterized protein n=1 Tax=Ixodes persulcatus TaxID=34615 RepID=A0AC60PD78_IXOPE|nr:hypothetical protein HPB47_005386 [Ixodes persulcatus]
MACKACISLQNPGRRMQKAESDSMFCQITASSIWPVEVLLERSVTGTVSNKAKAAGQEKAFPPLTPHKVQALSEACSDSIVFPATRSLEPRRRLARTGDTRHQLGGPGCGPDGPPPPTQTSV